jgi:hypothetical protein
MKDRIVGAGIDRVGRKPQPGETRLCLEPWKYEVVRHMGDVLPCCYGHGPIGNMARDSADTIANGDAVRELRRSLLTGENLPEVCQICPAAKLGDPATMRMMVRERMAARKRSIE